MSGDIPIWNRMLRSFQEKGYKTYIDVDGDNSYDIKFIMGLIPVKTNFKGVKDIVRKDSGSITISGRGGETVYNPVWLII